MIHINSCDIQTNEPRSDCFVKLKAIDNSRNNVLQLDNGTQILVIREDQVPQIAKINKNEVFDFSGFVLSSVKFTTKGSVILTFCFCKKHKIDIKMHIVPNDYLPRVDGMISEPFSKELKAVTDEYRDILNFHLLEDMNHCSTLILYLHVLKEF